MTDYKIVEVDKLPYIYVPLKCSMDPQDVSNTMGKGFKEVADYMQSNNIEFAGPALSVYYSYDENSLEFRAGFIINDDDMNKTGGKYQSAHTPNGQVLSLTHIGTYKKLRDTYAKMMQYIGSNDMEIGTPTWEVYVTDPDSTPEDELRTDIYVKLASVSASGDVNKHENA